MSTGLRDRITPILEKMSDLIMDLPRYKPSDHLPAPRLIAHRGAWNTSEYPENTMRAFERARNLGAWGIEFDVRFTKDGVPVVNHDFDLIRCHKCEGIVHELKFPEIRSRAPLLPTLEEVLGLSGVHFMIEVKSSLNAEQRRTLKRILSPFEPVRDFHLLTLNPAHIDSTYPPESWILVGDAPLGSLVNTALEREIGGVAGHYLGMTGSCISRLRDRGRKVGVGFIPTANLYRREWSRGIDWVFTNSLQRIRS